MLDRLRDFFEAAFHRKRFEDEMSSELRFHLETYTEDLVRSGVPRAEAERRAKLEFGGVEGVREQCRQSRGLQWPDEITRNVRFAARTLRKSPTFTITALVTLALGIGANTAIFSVVNSVLLRPLPYPEPEQLYAIQETDSRLAETHPTLPVNARHFDEWRRRCSSCEAITLLSPQTVALTGEGQPLELNVVRVTADIFPMLALPVQRGRALDRGDEEFGKHRVLLISDALWRQRFGADPGIVGRKVVLSGNPHEIVGVLGPGFWLPKGQQLAPILENPRRIDAIMPLALQYENMRPTGNHNFAAIVRLKPQVSAQRATAEINAAIAPFAEKTKFEMGAILYQFMDRVTGGVRHGLWLLLGAVSAVLLIVCVNLGNLMLVRANGRTRDAAIRRSLGATRAHLRRLVLVESSLLALFGGAGGVGLAYAGVKLLVFYAPGELPRLEDVRLDLAALVFAFCVSAGAAILSGLLPAQRLSAATPQDALRDTPRGASVWHRRSRTRQVLVGFEAALSTILLVLGGLLGLSFFRLTTVEKGFETQHILALDLSLQGREFEQRMQFHENLLRDLRALQGVVSAGLITKLPLEGETWLDVISTPGEVAREEDLPVANYRFVSPGYFETMGIALRAGRAFEEADRGRDVAMISSLAAERLWPGEEPIGKRYRQGLDKAQPFLEVIGVVEDIRTVSLEREPVLMAYLPYWTLGPGSSSYVIRTRMDPLALAAPVREVVWNLDRELPIRELRTMDHLLVESVAQRRFQTTLAVVFAVSGLLLAALGIYGVVSYSVAQRTNEIGIRMALGADPARLVRMVVRQGIAPVCVGLVAGVLAALALGRVVESLLFGISPRDPLTYSAVVALLVVVASLACWVPARRAAKVNPVTALRYE